MEDDDKAVRRQRPVGDHTYPCAYSQRSCSSFGPAVDVVIVLARAVFRHTGHDFRRHTSHVFERSRQQYAGEAAGLIEIERLFISVTQDAMHARHLGDRAR